MEREREIYINLKNIIYLNKKKVLEAIIINQLKIIEYFNFYKVMK